MADYCEDIAKELVLIGSSIESPATVLNAVDPESMQFIDVLIENEQKMVISEYVVQQYLQQIWEGGLDMSAMRMLGFFLAFVLIPPVWFCLSIPVEFKLNKIPVVKFMAYLTSHVYFVVFLSLTCVLPPDGTVRLVHRHWTQTW